MDRDRVQGGLVAAARGLPLAVVAIVCGFSLLVLSVLSIAFIPLGVGLLTTPAVLGLVRSYAGWRRSLTGDWGGIETPEPYLPRPDDRRPGLAGQVERCLFLLRDQATWRDLQWLAVDATLGFLLALLPPALTLYGVQGTVVAAGAWRAIRGDSFLFVPLTSQSNAFLAMALGWALTVVGLLKGAEVLRLHFRLTRALLAPTEKMMLNRRVERLYETRHDAVDVSAAELRRIERDLHDGAQARLVAMGMSLGAIEALIERDPQQARKLVAQARQNSADALSELRDLVRGIHPPVLAERGLGDAVKALALRMEIPVEVTVDLPGRLAEPVEAAAYFAVSEVLTNAAKHSGADRIWLDLGHDAADGMLRITVTDNGRGGADPARGTGLAGVERRLGTFDGILAVSSPVGGPTMATMEIPCAPGGRAGPADRRAGSRP
ncbi:sensor domain-containing protein [Streptomyces sp. TRM 70361]|uniref:sensor histidine kinase n=1 Tax=Streptomyces sp. TRM 70361 TaxID=3116553 RepID=UPI002E7B05DF|nr:sensor domain-containing protein [Streptomyces sp. TRM 70361]MEE1939939.1 sensor domain-containing protein [Streptomyces sp. TRM 70361]